MLIGGERASRRIAEFVRREGRRDPKGYSPLSSREENTADQLQTFPHIRIISHRHIRMMLQDPAGMTNLGLRPNRPNSPIDFVPLPFVSVALFKQRTHRSPRLARRRNELARVLQQDLSMGLKDIVSPSSCREGSHRRFCSVVAELKKVGHHTGNHMLCRLVGSLSPF